MEKLIIDGDGDKPLEFELEHDVVTLGRNAENRISIQNRYLSQFHARFSRVEGKRGREILDLDSYNGTKVNGQRIMREMLRPGDTIQFGLLTARYESSAEVSRNKDAAPATRQHTENRTGKRTQNRLAREQERTDAPRRRCQHRQPKLRSSSTTS